MVDGNEPHTYNVTVFAHEPHDIDEYVVAQVRPLTQIDRHLVGGSTCTSPLPDI